MPPPVLPIDALLPDIVGHLRNVQVLVLRAPPGAGKTTRVPPALLDAGVAGDRQIVLLQPRRVAARAAAARIAEERGSQLGGEIGYQVRFEKRTSRGTRIVAMTDGLFIRLLQDDPFLENVGAVLFDEFHERSLTTDLSLAMARRVQQTVRADLRLVVMSATLDVGPVAEYLGGAPIVESQGRLHPVSTSYLPFSTTLPVETAVADGIVEVLGQTSGDVLAFLPGVGEIRRTEERLSGVARAQNLVVRQLYGDLPLEEQQAALRRGAQRKVILATNVAETSLTIEGVTGVVDSGLARQLQVVPSLGLNRLEVVRISRASAEQRAGRAGRTAAGVCRRLWTEREQRALAEHDVPEVRRVDLCGAVLQLLCWGEADLRAFPWYEPPPAAAIDQALGLLRRLGAVDDRGATELGRALARLPVHPRLGRLMLESQHWGHPEAGALAAALLAERDPFLRSSGRHVSQHSTDSDVLDRVAALEAFERAGDRRADVGRIDPGAARFVLRARDQLCREVEQVASPAPVSVSRDQAVLRGIFAGFVDRLARRRKPGERKARMLGGRGVVLAEQSAVRDAELFVCVEIDEVGRADSLVRQASVVERGWLAVDALETSVDVEFDATRSRIVGVRRTRYGDLVLDEVSTNVPEEVDASALLAEHAAQDLDRALQLDDEALNYLARIRCLREWLPQLDLPDLGADPRAALLPRLCVGCLSFDDLRRAGTLAAVQSLLTPAQQQAVEREAPERIVVPSGSRIGLQYEAGKPPILAVRIQEVFGLKETPRIAGGRVPVLMHLLAPNMRPQQITGDLSSFWQNTYPEVRKELRRRYPKHAWPEDPWNATPQRRPTKKQ